MVGASWPETQLLKWRMVGQASPTIMDHSLQCPNPLRNSTWLPKIYSIYLIHIPICRRVQSKTVIFYCHVWLLARIMYETDGHTRAMSPAILHTFFAFHIRTIWPSGHLIKPHPFVLAYASRSSRSFSSFNVLQQQIPQPDRRDGDCAHWQIMRSKSSISTRLLGGWSEFVHHFGSGWYWPTFGYLGPRVPSKIKNWAVDSYKDRSLSCCFSPIEHCIFHSEIMNRHS